MVRAISKRAPSSNSDSHKSLRRHGKIDGSVNGYLFEVNVHQAKFVFLFTGMAVLTLAGVLLVLKFDFEAMMLVVLGTSSTTAGTFVSRRGEHVNDEGIVTSRVVMELILAFLPSTWLVVSIIAFFATGDTSMVGFALAYAIGCALFEAYRDRLMAWGK